MCGGCGCADERPALKRIFLMARVFRSAKALLPPHECGGCHQDAGEGEASASRAPHPLEATEEKVSGMCPV